MIITHGQGLTNVTELTKVPLLHPKQETSTRYRPIDHYQLMITLLNACYRRGWTASNTQIQLTKDTRGLAASFDLEVPDLPTMAGTHFSLGILHANDLRRSLMIAVGARIVVCNNGLITGEILIKHKHTSGFDLREEIDDALGDYQRKAKKIECQVVAMKRHSLTPMEEEHILLETGRQNLLPWSAVGKLDAEYRNPSFEEFRGRTAWSMMNAFTHIVKQKSPMGQIEAMTDFRKLLPVTEVNQ